MRVVCGKVMYDDGYVYMVVAPVLVVPCFL